MPAPLHVHSRFLEPAQSPPFHWAGPTCPLYVLKHTGTMVLSVKGHELRRTGAAPVSRMFVALLARYPLLDNGWVSFGVLPVLAFIVGYLGTAIPLELILPLVPDAQTITYKKDKG